MLCITKGKYDVHGEHKLLLIVGEVFEKKLGMIMLFSFEHLQKHAKSKRVLRREKST
jgi:hypothetical protein